MTRKGRLPIPLPKGVEVKVTDSEVLVKGPKGNMQQELMPGIKVNVENEQITVSLEEKHKEKRNFQGLYRSLIQNMVYGATEGFEKRLDLIGVGFRAAVQGNMLQLTVGFSHPVKIPIPEGIQVKVEKNTKIIINGVNKQQVGQFAAVIRSKRSPEPYKGKGIRYENEYVRKKAGKAAAKK